MTHPNYQGDYTHAELLDWIKKQFPTIRKEYKKRGQLESDRILSAAAHGIKSFFGLGNIATLAKAIKVMDDPKKHDGEKLHVVVRILLAIVDRKLDLTELDGHHTTCMLSALLQELTRYNSLPKELKNKINEVLSSRYHDISIEAASYRYTELNKSLKEQPHLDSRPFSEMVDERASKKRRCFL